MSVKAHRVNDRQIIKHIKQVTIPYDDLVEILNEDGEAFLEGPLKRQTIWKAAKRLSEALGKKVRYDRALLRVDGVDVLEGYSFSIEDPESQPPKDTA